MREISFTVSSDGTISSGSDLFLGFGGEHNAAVLRITVDEGEGSVFYGSEYYRLVFDDYLSEAVNSDGGVISFKVPQNAVNPPCVACQLVSYKTVNGEIVTIAKSEVIRFNVSFSKQGANALSVEPDVYERMLATVESRKQEALSAAAASEQSAEIAVSNCERAVLAEENCNKASNNCDEKSEVTTSAADFVSRETVRFYEILGKNGFCNALKEEVSGVGICRIDAPSPINSNVTLSLNGTNQLMQGAGQIYFEPTESCILRTDEPIVCAGSGTAFFTVLFTDGTSVDFCFPQAGEYLLNVKLSISGDTFSVGGILTQSDGTEHYIDDFFSTTVAQGIAISGVVFDSDVTVYVYSGMNLNTVYCYGKNLWPLGDVDVFEAKTYDVDLPVGTYTLSASVKSGYSANKNIRIHDMTNNVLLGYLNQELDRSSITFTLSAPCNRITLYAAIQFNLATGYTANYRNIQIEVGSQATDFEDYKEPIEYFPDNDGNVVFTPQEKHLTVISSDRQITVSATYFKDINYAIDRLEKAVIALGGVL